MSSVPLRPIENWLPSRNKRNPASEWDERRDIKMAENLLLSSSNPVLKADIVAGATDVISDDVMTMQVRPADSEGVDFENWYVTRVRDLCAHWICGSFYELDG